MKNNFYQDLDSVMDELGLFVGVSPGAARGGYSVGTMFEEPDMHEYGIDPKVLGLP